MWHPARCAPCLSAFSSPAPHLSAGYPGATRHHSQTPEHQMPGATARRLACLEFSPHSYPSVSSRFPWSISCKQCPLSVLLGGGLSPGLPFGGHWFQISSSRGCAVSSFPLGNWGAVPGLPLGKRSALPGLPPWGWGRSPPSPAPATPAAIWNHPVDKPGP